MDSSHENLAIRRGSILIYRVFDVAEEIDLVEIEKIISQPGGQSRLKLTRTSRNAIVMRNAPVRIALGESEIRFGGRSWKAETYVRAWDYGAFSISFHVPIPPDTRWSELVRMAEALNQVDSSEGGVDAVAAKRSREMTQLLSSALKRRSEWTVSEDYVIYFLEDVEGLNPKTGDGGAAELLKRVDVPALILGEPSEALADVTRAAIHDSVFQYAKNDLAVIDWNSALLVEPNGQRDVADVLEFALTHLLEARYYDDLLDRRLTEVYSAAEERRNSLLRTDFSRLTHEANTRYLEFAEIMERVDNSLKVVGDFYLAVIFRAAVRRFRIPDWQQSITRKMNLMAKVSELLLGETNVYRSHFLEFVIILLIAYEIVSAALG